MGNTGFGLGDTAAVLYSEKLNVLFADRLDGSMTVGQALAFAKQEYAATPTQSGYHLKVIDQADADGPADVPGRHRGHGSAADAGDHDDRLGHRPADAPFNVSPSFTRVDTAIGTTTSRTTRSPRTAARSSRRRSSTSRSPGSSPTAR